MTKTAPLCLPFSCTALAAVMWNSSQQDLNDEDSEAGVKFSAMCQVLLDDLNELLHEQSLQPCKHPIACLAAPPPLKHLCNLETRFYSPPRRF